MDIVVIGIDLGKNSCSPAGLDALGRIVLRRRMRRSSLESFVKGIGRCGVAMDACCGAHHLGRIFAAERYEVRLMSPEYVRPYVKAQRTTTSTPKRLLKRRPGRRCGLLKSRATPSRTSRRCTGRANGWCRSGRR